MSNLVGFQKCDFPLPPLPKIVLHNHVSGLIFRTFLESEVWLRAYEISKISQF